jgi:hypothetical protein
MPLSVLSAWHAPQWERFAARSVLLLWAAFWIWFGFASGLSERLPPMGIFIHTAAPGLVFALIAAAAWRWERASGWFLIGLAILILFAYNEMMGHRGIAFVLQVGSILAAPPAISGVLFLIASSGSESKNR